MDSSKDPHLYTGGLRAIQQMNTELRLQGRQYDAPDDVLASLAPGTGGTFFHNSNALEAGYRQLGSVPGVVYVLGISLSDVAQDSSTISTTLAFGWTCRRCDSGCSLGTQRPQCETTGRRCPPPT